MGVDEAADDVPAAGGECDMDKARQHGSQHPSFDFIW